MANFDDDCKNLDLDDLDEKLGTSLAKISEAFLDESIEKIKDGPVNHWMEIASPILKSGGKPVALILALGFMSIPLVIGGVSCVTVTLAIGASATAIVSLFLP